MLEVVLRRKVKFLLGIAEDSWMIGSEPDRPSHLRRPTPQAGLQKATITDRPPASRGRKHDGEKTENSGVQSVWWSAQLGEVRESLLKRHFDKPGSYARPYA